MTPLYVRAAGMVTAVGLDTESSCAAMRARLDGIRETRFVDGSGEWLIGAGVPLPRGWIGEKRMAHLLAGALVALQREEPLAADAPLILCLSEPDRHGPPIRDADSFVATLSEFSGRSSAAKTHVVSHGRPAGFVAFEKARKILASGDFQNVIVAGIDSYLTGPSIAQYLAVERLVIPDNGNAFVAGEAAAAVLCSREPGGLRLRGIGLTRERASIYNGQGDNGADLPLRGDAMAAAYRAALAEADTDYFDVDYRIADLSGEHYFFKQSALASMRNETASKPFRDLWCPAESVGNIGSAVVPLMAGIALTADRRGYAAGPLVLIEASGDDGACGAAVFEAVRTK